MCMEDEHIIKVESIQVFRGDVEPDMAEFLTNDGVKYDRTTESEIGNQGPPMEFHIEERRTFECTCGRRFRKGETARQHLEDQP